MTRLSHLSEDQLDESQRAFMDSLARGPRGARQGRIGLIGPYGVWAHAPHVGEPAQQLGATLRFGIGLAENVKEVAICTVGAFFHARFEFAAHRRLALAAGVDEDLLNALQAGKRPPATGDEAIAHAVAEELLTHHRLSDGTYADALAAFEEAGLVELVSLIGYYAMISFTLNAFDVDLVDGMVDPWPEPTRST